MILRGDIGITALAVALCRYQESNRPDALFADPLAGPLVDEFGPGLKELFSFDEKTTRDLYANIAARTAYFDEIVLDQLPSFSQVVVLGAGLETRFHRLGRKRDAHWWEIDQRSVLEVKDSFLTEQIPGTDQHRTSVAADLTKDWPTALTAAGHDVSKPTIWVVEGVFSYLSETQNDMLVETVTEQSATNSLLLATHWGPGKHADEYGQALQAATEEHDVSFQSSVTDPEAWLAQFGWRTRTTTLREQALRFNRSTAPQEAPGNEVGWLISAQL